MRTELSPGTVIELSCDDGAVRKFQIDQVIGNGANCIAYEAHRAEDIGPTRNYRIKECYPYDAHIERLGTQLKWENDSERSAAFARLQNAHELIVELRNVETVGNNVTAAELHEGNGTLYSVMEVNHAKTYDKDSDSDLHRILETMRVLTEVVGNLHEQGYLHLDIKPENFLVNHRPNTNIWLFDVDSLVSMKELESGEVQTVSYSQRWAAPEQLRGQVDKICPATDLYAIGAILFEKVMGRPVANEDTGLFAEWNFDGELFAKVNPKIKRILCEIFKKTLSASIKRRYQTTTELLLDLNAAIKTVKDQVYLVSDNIGCTIDFIGREESLKKIETAFQTGNQLVFLHGFGGIGKTELAKMYAHSHHKRYDAIVFLKYDRESTLQELLDDVQIENFEGEAKEHRRKLRTLLNENVLVLIDNFDVELGVEDGIELLLKTKANILVTTRTDFSDAYKQGATQIEIGPLSYSELERVFISNSSRKEISDREQLLLGKVFELIEYHTFAAVLLAKQMFYSGWNFDTLYTNIGRGLKSLGNSGKIVTTKDERTIKDNSLNILRAIFRISSLSVGQQQVLRSMYLLNFVKMTKEAYLELTTECDLNALLNKTEEERMAAQTNSIDNINDLVELGLISVENGCFTLHKLIYELVGMELTPDEINCANIYFYMLSIVDWFAEENDDSSPARQAEAENKAIVFLRFLDGVDLSHQVNLLFALRWLEHIFDSPFYAMDTSYVDEKLVKLYYRLEKLLDRDDLEEKHRLCIVLFRGWLYRCNFFFVIDSEEEYHEREICEQKSQQFFRLAIACAAEIDGIPTGEHTREIISHIAHDLEQSVHEREVIRSLCGDVTSEDSPLMSRIPTKIIHEAYAIMPDAFDMSVRDKRYYGFSLTDEDLEELPADPLFCDDEIDAETEEWIRLCNKIKEDSRQASDKVSFLMSLPENDQYTPFQKVSLLEDLLERIFGPISVPQKRKKIEESEQYLRSMNWNVAEILLNLQSRIAAKNDDYDWCDGDEEALSHIPKYRAIISAMFASDDFAQWVEWAIETDDYYKNHYPRSDVEFYFGGNLSEILNACIIMRKCRYILPFLTRELLKELPDVETAEFEEVAGKYYPMIEETVLCAKRAVEELGVEDIQADPILDKIKEAAINAQKECSGTDDIDESAVLLKTYSQSLDFFSKILNWLTHKKFDLKPEEK